MAVVAQSSYIFGLRKGVTNNLCFLDDQTVVFPAGNNCVRYNIDQKWQKFIPDMAVVAKSSYIFGLRKGVTNNLRFLDDQTAVFPAGNNCVRYNIDQKWQKFIPECRGPRTNSGQRQPPIRAFMDDLTVMTESVPGCRWILKGLEELVEWARMRFKPAKSSSMVLRKGKVVDKFRFNIADTAIPSISEKPVKSLGKVFDRSLRDNIYPVDLH
ncbi:hypothetical protein NHX12_004227 [Muraenolepis orangiensis]|uniref:Reverse transcriptase domain-containing protein n=1 Tax=Muraenolepis orangiensis TaxID=630683 RepID=A0A9Q0DUZ4_9TELE|nr:hypothetical protein NHX12_004227 [Muraenolepis orangiensis]